MPYQYDPGLEQQLAELSDEEFDAVVNRTRPPRAPSGSKSNHHVIPGIGNQPTGGSQDRAAIAAAEQAGDWAGSFRLKTQQLNRLMHKRT